MKMSYVEKRMRRALGLRTDKTAKRSTRLSYALNFIEQHRGLSWSVTYSSDGAWGNRKPRENEGVVDSRVVGVNRVGKGGWEYVIVYVYTRKRCAGCGKLIKWGKKNPYVPYCVECKKKKENNE